MTTLIDDMCVDRNSWAKMRGRAAKSRWRLIGVWCSCKIKEELGKRQKGWSAGSRTDHPIICVNYDLLIFKSSPKITWKLSKKSHQPREKSNLATRLVNIKPARQKGRSNDTNIDGPGMSECKWEESHIGVIIKLWTASLHSYALEGLLESLTCVLILERVEMRQKVDEGW